MRSRWSSAATQQWISEDPSGIHQEWSTVYLKSPRVPVDVWFYPLLADHQGYPCKFRLYQLARMRSCPAPPRKYVGVLVVADEQRRQSYV